MSGRPPSLLLAAAISAATLTPPAAACPFCDSDRAREVREGLLDPATLPDALAALSPAPVTLALIVALRRRPARRPTDTPDDPR